jgi:hypothetical protein
MGVLIFRPGAGTTAATRQSPTTDVAAAPNGTVPQPGARRSSPARTVQPETADVATEARKQAAQAQSQPAPDRRAKAHEVLKTPTSRGLTAESAAKGPDTSKKQLRTVTPELAKAKPQEIPAKDVAPPKMEKREAMANVTDWGDPIDPDGDCRVVVEPARVKIFIPGKPHILSAEIRGLNAPRILRNVRGDFDARVSVAGVFQPAGKSTVKAYLFPYHGAGILLWQDEENYVRLEIASEMQRGKRRPYVNFEYRKAGALAVSTGLNNADSSSHLRLRRRGGEIYAGFGPDGHHWTSFPPLVVNLKDQLSIGLTAINTATRPLDAELEGFQVSEMSTTGKAAGDGGSKAP